VKILVDELFIEKEEKKTVKNIKILDAGSVSETNIKGKEINLNAFDLMFKEMRIIVANYGSKEFNKILGLAYNFNITSKAIYCDVEIFDVNGFDTDLFIFFKTGITNNAFRIRPLIEVLKIENNIITKADMKNLGVVL
jgi:hypothetical protein